MTTKTSRPATAAEIAATAGRPAHKQVVTVETDTDGRATLGKAKTVHRATIIRDLNAHGETVGKVVMVGCGSRLYRNAAGKAQPTATSNRYDVDCAKCLAHPEA